MLRVGLTGGIASGKSTVAAFIKKRGYEVLDADALGHELIQSGEPAYGDILNTFGHEILAHSSNQIDRAKLAAIVFADPAKLATLNGILHPRILEQVKRWFDVREQHIHGTKKPPFAFVEAALLVEAGYRTALDRLVVCWSKPGQQLERLIARGLTKEKAQQRLAAQMDVDAKRRAADDVIDCSGSLEETERQTDQLLQKLESAAHSGNIS
jgi:dephospho-CoA kinase